MPLPGKYKQQLRSLAHALKPVVTIGSNGLTAAVQLEIHRALEDHELIKVKLAISDRDEKKRVTQAIVDEQDAELIQTIGHIVVIYRISQKLQSQDS